MYSAPVIPGTVAKAVLSISWEEAENEITFIHGITEVLDFVHSLEHRTMDKVKNFSSVVHHRQRPLESIFILV
jgi:hypothetical protein